MFFAATSPAFRSRSAYAHPFTSGPWTFLARTAAAQACAARGAGRHFLHLAWTSPASPASS
jgi:hypothetical protein